MGIPSLGCIDLVSKARQESKSFVGVLALCSRSKSKLNERKLVDFALEDTDELSEETKAEKLALRILVEFLKSSCQLMPQP